MNRVTHWTNRLIIYVATMLFVSCSAHKVRTNDEMQSEANEAFLNYLFEYAIDPALFTKPVITDRDNDAKSYTWLSNDFDKSGLGLDVRIEKNRNSEPITLIMGKSSRWITIIGSKHDKPQ